MLEYIPEHLDFEVQFEPTKMDDKKYVINSDTNEYIGIVGKDFKCVSHGDFFRDVIKSTSDTLKPHQLEGAEARWKSAHKDGWAMLDIMLPNMKTTIANDVHETSLMKRVIALHGVNGTCSNIAIFGAIDFFCTNGQIIGDHNKVLRENTSNFSLDRFIVELEKSQQDFNATAQQLQRWANTSIAHVDVKALLDTIMKSERKAEKMNILYNQEVADRGRNMFALYSAFTNYATYADERNGFNLRNTGNDTQAVSMFKREVEVANWIGTPAFKSLDVKVAA